MPIFLSIIILIGLFIILGGSAIVVVNNVKKIALHLGIPMFILGAILGILTSFPEFSIAVSASINNVRDISIGNLFGGIMVILGLILGLCMILNRKIKTDGDVMTPLPGFFLLILPLILGLDRVLSFNDGLILCIGYVTFLTHLYYKNQHVHDIHPVIVKKKTVIKEILLAIGGTLTIVIASSLIINIATHLLLKFSISQFLLGLIVFSIGTNLPELTVIITSWRKKIRGISFSHILGSAIVNPLILGIMAMISPLTMTIDFSYILILYFFILISILLLYFYRSNRTLSRPEGVVLILIFLMFTYLQYSIH